MVEASKATPIHMQILFAVLMGLRRGEINGLKYSDVDYINRTLKIQRQLGKKPNSKAEDVPPKMLTKQEIKHKTPSSIREIPIPDMCLSNSGTAPDLREEPQTAEQRVP